VSAKLQRAAIRWLKRYPDGHFRKISDQISAKKWVGLLVYYREATMNNPLTILLQQVK